MNLYKKRILFVGIPDMAYVCLDGLKMAGFNIVGAFGAKKNHPTYDDFKSFVCSRNIEFIEYDNLNDDEFIDKIKNLNVDLAVVCSFNYKIPKKLLDTVKDGFLNLHPSLLPKYRGANPYSRVLINKEKATGVTLHFMDEEFDTGDIVAQSSLQIAPRETMGTLFNRLNLLGLELLVKTLKLYEKKPLPRRKQDAECSIKGEALSNQEMTIDFNKPAIDIERFIRALNPFVNANTLFRGTMVKIFSAKIYDAPEVKSKPGTIEKVFNGNIYISTGKGYLIPTVLQFGSFFIATSQDFIEILNPKIGEEFGVING
ncbi:methionyl-tRNA formyltransferase [bacterium]|nr:methionyl-tRNA formyltransferase [bacterium]